MRLFIALSLPEDVREQLAALASGLPGAKWLPPENLHLTLRFVGEVDHAVAEDLHDMLSGINARGFQLTVEGLGIFSEGRRLTTLWAGVQANDALNRLQAKVEQATKRAGLPPERRRFKPHVTLARFKSDPGPKLQAFLSRHGLLRIGPFPVQDFVLYSSFLSQSGALHSAEAIYPLEPSEPAESW